MANNAHPNCKCTLMQSLTGDGCRYCQPQEYIDHLHDHMVEDESDWRDERAKLAEALGECARVLERVGNDTVDGRNAAMGARTLLSQLGENWNE